jgi:carbonic anhydrase/acetyltransferase-like protein (isoleucine patch superfamily)
MTTFAVTDPDHTIDAINYLLSNLNASSGTGNVTIPGNVLVANTTTGVVSQYGNTAVFGYLYQYVNLRYSNNSTGGGGSFSTTPTNLNYFGVFNSTTPTPSANPTDYQWYEVAGGFGTTKILYYSAFGGRQVAWAAANSAPSSNYVASVANVAIDLDVVTTAAGTPGERGPVVMAAVITTADPNFATSSTLTGWFEAPRNANTAPIGTGLIPPVLGDTASFTYAAGVGQPQAAYSYNGSQWVPVDGQVISGNVIVRGTIAGNAMIANTITATQIATDTITANNIAGNTITSAKIATGTITAVNIAGNTITGNNIAAGTITTNNFTANTIQGNIIAAGTITATQLAANAITANTVVSTGAVLGSYASVGFWLDGPSGNARFGNTLSIGNQLTVGGFANIGASAQIGANLLVGTGANIGTNLIVSANATIGANLVVGNNANIGANLRVGSGANIGTNLIVGSGANIGTNLIVGNNASIGGNLTVTGLITGSNLLSNTVATLTIQPSAVTDTFGVQSSSGRIATNASSGTNYLLTGTATVSVPTPNAVVTVNWSSSISATWSSGGSIYLYYKIFRSVGGGAFSEVGSSAITGPYSPFVITGDGQSALYVDTATTTYGSGVTYRYQVYVAPIGTFTFLNIDRNVAAIAAQVFKR